MLPLTFLVLDSLEKSNQPEKGTPHDESLVPQWYRLPFLFFGSGFFSKKGSFTDGWHLLLLFA